MELVLGWFSNGPEVDVGEKQPFQTSAVLFFFLEAVWSSPLGACGDCGGRMEGAGHIVRGLSVLQGKSS